MRTTIFRLLLCFISFYAIAQPPHEHRDMHMPSSPKLQAKMMTDEMQKEVNLNSKQYKAIYNLFTKDFKFIQKVRKAIQGGMPPQGGRHGMAGPGISYGNSKGEMGFSADSRGADLSGSVNLGQGVRMNGSVGAGGGGVGFKGGFTIGGGHGNRGSSMGGGRPDGHPGPHHNEMEEEQIPIPEKYLNKEDTKIRKILSPGQYKMWREKHPFDYLTYLYKPKKRPEDF